MNTNNKNDNASQFSGLKPQTLEELNSFLKNPKAEINLFFDSEDDGNHSHRYWELLFFRHRETKKIIKLNIVPPGISHKSMSTALFPDGLRLQLTRSLFTGSDGRYLLKEYFGSSGILELLICDFEQIRRCRSNNLSREIEQRHIMNMKEDLIQMLNTHIKYRFTISRKQHLFHAKTYIISNAFRFDLQMSEVSDYIGISPNSLSKLFRVNLGCTARQYLVKVRLRRACEMLNDNSRELYQVAAYSGWKDYKYFAKVFRKEFKMTAGEMAEKFRNNEMTIADVDKIIGNY